jgi:hypothetical protein
MITCGTQIVSGSTGGGASAPAGTGVVTASGGAFVDPVASAATTRATLDAMQDVFTTRGDLVRAGVSGVAERVAIGANGYVLTSDGTDPVWATPSGGGSGVPARLIAGFTDANHFTRAATAAADAVGGAGYSWLVCGYLSTSTASLRKAWEYQTAGAGWGFIVNGTSVQMYMAGINGGAGLSTPFNVGLTLTAGAAFAIVVEYVTGELRATLNGGTVAVTSLTGTFAPATAASAMGIGGDRVNAITYGFAEGKLAECDMISGALGDAAIQAFALDASTTYSFASQFSQAQRAALKFSWVASDGGAPVRVGYGPLTTAGTLLASQPV